MATDARGEIPCPQAWTAERVTDEPGWSGWAVRCPVRGRVVTLSDEVPDAEQVARLIARAPQVEAVASELVERVARTEAAAACNRPWRLQRIGNAATEAVAAFRRAGVAGSTQPPARADALERVLMDLRDAVQNNTRLPPLAVHDIALAAHRAVEAYELLGAVEDEPPEDALPQSLSDLDGPELPRHAPRGIGGGR